MSKEVDSLDVDGFLVDPKIPLWNLFYWKTYQPDIYWEALILDKSSQNDTI